MHAPWKNLDTKNKYIFGNITKIPKIMAKKLMNKTEFLYKELITSWKAF